MFHDKETALNFLKNLSTIVMPTQFTYLNHCTFYIPEKYRQNYSRKIWEEFPKDGFQITDQMSFTERNKRIEEALQQGGASKAAIKYNIPSTPHFPFIIRVVIPKKDNNLNLPEQQQNELTNIYNGYGDNRHPKLTSGENIIMFASSSKDEVSGKDIDILYGVRESDIITYANQVFLEIIKGKPFKESKMPEVQERTVKTSTSAYTAIKTEYEYNLDFDFAKDTYVIPKDKTSYKFEKRPIVDKNHDIQAYMMPEYENITTTRKSR